MARLETMTEAERKHFEETELPAFDSSPWVDGPPLDQRRVAIVSTAGIHKRNDRPFQFRVEDYYRVIPGDIKADDLIMSHVSTNFDRSGFQQDLNVIFPIDRLQELAEKGTIGSLADYHYSFMGAHEPASMEPQARAVADLLKKDKVDAVLLIPV